MQTHFVLNYYILSEKAKLPCLIKKHGLIQMAGVGTEDTQ